VLAVALFSTGLSLRGEEFRFHEDGILGTSFDLTVAAAHSNDAARVEKTVLAQVERLRRILSTYDAKSDISRVNAGTAPVVVAPELIEVLTAYDQFAARSRGAYSGQLGGLIRAWKDAEIWNTGVPPPADAIRKIVSRLGQPGWEINAAARTVTRKTSEALNIDSLGKGYIISKAAAAARATSPKVHGFLLNIGGDLFASGSRSPTSTVPWRVSVANPRNPADNFLPLTRLSVSDGAVSTSAGYARGFKIGRHLYSHILDPRTGWPATNVASATVVAADSPTANALATTLCVLKPEEGLQLIQESPGASCLIVAPDGRQFRSGTFAAYEVKRDLKPNLAKPGLWPEGYEVAVQVTLKTPDTPRSKRPYLVLWIENSEGKAIRTVTLWGNKSKYFRDLSGWWRFAQDDLELVSTVTRATREFGKYTLVWDGRDDLGEPLPPGQYTLVLEVAREHGTHARRSAKIVCGRDPAQAVIPAGSEFEAAPVNYGPHGG
jgi:thiamine biosynthesis lipoprotein ApbE